METCKIITKKNKNPEISQKVFSFDGGGKVGVSTKDKCR